MCELTIPEYLYHYTSIDTLALILKNKTIRLNPLTKLDDKQEQKTADVKNIGKFVFVSSWTSEIDESIPMWEMYTKPTAGVRIKLKTNPFLQHQTSFKDVVNALGLTVVNQSDLNVSVPTFLNLSILIRKGYFSPQAWSGDILKMVRYTNDISLLEPQILSFSKEGFQLAIGKMGIYKDEHWSYQKEWRYLMTFLPLDLSSMNTVEERFKSMVLNLTHGKEKPPFEYYDLDLDPESFKQMDITLSPKISDANRIIVESLIQKHNPYAHFHESVLWGNL